MFIFIWLELLKSSRDFFFAVVELANVATVVTTSTKQSSTTLQNGV